MFLSLFLLFFISVANPQAITWNTYPFNPPSLPLAAKSPYVNVWAPQGPNPVPINKNWPQTWGPNMNIMGWNAATRVDGHAYNLLGIPNIANNTDANQTMVLFTPTRTSYLLEAGPVNINMTFFSPIEPYNLTRLSMPFTYLYLSATPNDNNQHEVQFYSDLSGEWISGNSSLLSNWADNNAFDFISLQMHPQQKLGYQEVESRPQDATLYHCMKKRPGLSWEIGNSVDIRTAFGNGSGLQNRTDNRLHAINNPFDTLGISVDVGNVAPGNESEPVVYAIGVLRDPVIQYINKQAVLDERSAYYWVNISSTDDIIRDVLDQFEDTLAASIELDNSLIDASRNISNDYADLISLVTRQTMSAIEYTIDRGSLNTSDVKAFMKNMGDIGSGQVNAVDVIYAAMPVYIYLNPDILGYLLNPLLEYQTSPAYIYPYAAIDLGGSYPNATGDNQSHDQGIEQSANMIILGLAHALTSGNGGLLAQYYDILAKWGNYLTDNVLTQSSANQTTSSSDEISSLNQTNLILKGIIGIRAMAEISSLTGHNDDEANFKNKAKQYYEAWESFSNASDRIALNPGESDSGLIYNLYADELLGLNMVNKSLYEIQTSFYSSKISGADYGFGVPIDEQDGSLTRSDWMLFAASSTTDANVRDSMISQVRKYASSNATNMPFPDVYNPSSGAFISGMNSPAQGAIFAPLALTVNKKDVTFSPAVGSRRRRLSPEATAGSVIGSVALATALVVCITVYCRRLQNKTMGIYNQRADRIEHVRPSVDQAAPVLDSTNLAPEHNSLHDEAIPVPFPLSEMYGRSHPTGNPSLNQAKGDTNNNSDSIPNSRSDAGNLDGQRPNSTGGQEVLRSEVENLRMMIERIREENAPPSYE